MSPIQIDMDEVQRLSTKLRQLEQRLFETIDNVSSMAQRVEGSIQAHRNMGDRLHGASQRLDELGDQVRALRGWIQRSCDAYAESEKQLSHQVAQIDEAGKHANAMSGQTGGYDTVTVVPLSEQTEENLTVMEHTAYSALQWVQEKHQSGFWSSMKQSLSSDVYMLKGIGEEAWDTVKSAGELAMDVNPVVQIYRWLSDPEGQKAEYKARGQLVLHPVQTWNVIKDGIVDDFRRQVIEGDDRSRSEYEGRRIFDFASMFIGVGEVKVAATAFKEFRTASKAMEAAEEAARAERAAESVTRAGGSGKIDETLADSLSKQDGLKEMAGRETSGIEKAGNAGRYSGKLEVVNKPDAAADALAERIGGQPRVRFSNDPANREFDAISDQYVAQSKPALQTVNKSVRDQMKATFEAAQETGRKVYYHFEGQPAQPIIDKLNEYSSRYGIEVVIDIKSLK